MQFSKHYLALISIVLLLNACAGAAKKEDIEQPAAEDVALPTEEAMEALPLVKIPKPVASSVSVPNSAREEFALAKQAMAKGNWQAAVGSLLIMTETYPQLAGVYVNLGIAYSKLEQFEEAENAYRFAIEKNPLNFDAYTNLGVLLREQGRFSEAEQVYLDALALWPHHQPSIINLGVLYDMYMGKLPEALSQFKLAQKLNDEEDRKLKGWIVDLQRRIPK